MIEASVKMSVVESIKNGVTYIFDHHSSPISANGSLAKIAETLLEINYAAFYALKHRQNRRRVITKRIG
jgi:hypothetical protein